MSLKIRTSSYDLSCMQITVIDEAGSIARVQLILDRQEVQRLAAACLDFLANTAPPPAERVEGVPA